MDLVRPETYLIVLIGLLVVVAILVGRQLLKVRKDEITLVNLERGGTPTSKDAAELYELASAQLRKRLYPQATSTLKQAVKLLNEEPNEAKALIENALGFSLSAQDDFKGAIMHYKIAIKAKSDYPVALNNLAFAKQRLNEYTEAYKIYKDVLIIDPSNQTAKKQMESIKNRVNIKSPDGDERRGF